MNWKSFNKPDYEKMNDSITLQRLQGVYKSSPLYIVNLLSEKKKTQEKCRIKHYCRQSELLLLSNCWFSC